jgi:hypothetical protein
MIILIVNSKSMVAQVYFNTQANSRVSLELQDGWECQQGESAPKFSWFLPPVLMSGEFA